jgi:RNA polymerase sigma factor (sigma-70 family)
MMNERPMTSDPNKENSTRLDSQMFLAAVKRKLEERKEQQPADHTSWTLIHGAAGCDQDARTLFVERYMPIVRTYLGARWRGKPYLVDLEDAVQEVFLQCFQDDGALERVDPARGSFSSFLYGVTRRVAQSFETKKARLLNRERPGSFHPDEMAIDETSLSLIFDRAWAMSIVREAGDSNRARAEAEGGDRLRRLELLRLRFHEGMPIREIAEMWEEDPKRVHWAYARAREEFKDALCEVLHHRGSAKASIDAECKHVFSLLS